MTQESLKHLSVSASEIAQELRGTVGVDEEELSALRQLAMRAAKLHGCEAGVEMADSIASVGDPPGSLRLKIVVAHRSRQGELLSHESNVVLMTSGYAASVAQIVRDAAVKLAER